MLRLFAEHDARRVARLDGLWDFITDPEGVGRRRRWFRRWPSSSGRMAVPGCWNVNPALYDYHGKAYYRRSVHCHEPGNLLLTLEGTGGAAEAWLDGRSLGRNAVSCLPWTVLAPGAAAGDHELVVEIDNSRDLEDVFPRYGNDWFHYGGLARPVEAAFLGEIWLKELRLPYSVARSGVTLRPEFQIANLGRKDRTETLALEINGVAIARWTIRLPAGRTVRVVRSLPEQRLALWSPDAPRLHTIRAVCGGDDLRERTGFRTLACRGRQLLLNGEPLKILGVNRHHEYGDSGFAVPPDIMLRDFEIIRDLGANAVRCHYPVDALAMDVCDEMGLLVWSEIPFYARWAAVVGDPVYNALAETAIERMVARDFNRPGVFAWSIMNECATNVPEGVRTVARFARKVRSLDRTRPVSYATNQLLNDRALRHVDLVGLNSYPGWYDDKRFAAWPEMIDGMSARIRKEAGGPRPMIVTETGAAGLYGDRSLESRKWSERFQADLLEQHLRYLLKERRVAGVFIWQFADVRTIREYWANRPGSFNNKGLLDRFRRPKEAFWRVREIYRTAAQVS